jgi:hypothetical protein
VLHAFNSNADIAILDAIQNAVSAADVSFYFGAIVNKHGDHGRYYVVEPLIERVLVICTAKLAVFTRTWSCR